MTPNEKIVRMRPATSDQRPATSDQRPATSDQPNLFPKIKVLFISYWGNLDNGAVLSMYGLVKDLRKRYNVEPTILAYEEETLTEQLKKDGIPTIISKHYNCTIHGYTPMKFAKALARNFLNHAFIYGKIISEFEKNNFDFDLIHTNTFPSDLGYTLSEHFNVPHIVHLREQAKKGFPSDFFLTNSMLRKRFAKTAAEIAISRSTYDFYVNERKVCQPEKTHIIYDGIKIIEPYEKNYHDDRVNFCIVGGIALHKRQITAIKACAKLKAYTDKFTLHIIGKGNEKYTDELKALVKSLGLEDNVKFPGFFWDIHSVLKDMDVGLMLSAAEAFGRVTVEEMLNYLPIIGVETGATPELVKDGETGFICPLDDAEKISERMKYFIEHPEMIRSMGQKARERAEKNFSLEKNTDEVYALYREILGR